MIIRRSVWAMGLALLSVLFVHQSLDYLPDNRSGGLLAWVSGIVLGIALVLVSRCWGDIVRGRQ